MGTIEDRHRRWLHNSASFLREHPALAGTIAYSLASAIGLIYSRTLLRLFGIEMLDYAQLTDFFLAALKVPGSILVALAIAIFYSWSVRFAARTEADTSVFRFHVNMFLAGIPLAVFAVFFYTAIIDAEQVRSGKGQVVFVSLKDVPSSSLPSEAKVVIIGGTEAYIFFFDLKSGKSFAIERESIAYIKY